MIKGLFILIFWTTAWGQVDTSKIKIISKNYEECVLVEMEIQEDGMGNENDTIPTYGDIISVSYPYIQTEDKKLNKFINDTIQKIVGVYGKTDNPCPKEAIYIDENPATSTTDYVTDFINSKLISLTIKTDEYACCGANGSSHAITPMTFDLLKYKILTLSDIIKKGQDSIVCKIIIDQLWQTNQNLLSSFDNKSELSNIKKVLNSWFAVTQKGIIVYWTLSYGHGQADTDVNLAFEKYRNLFKKKFINLIKINNSH